MSLSNSHHYKEMNSNYDNSNVTARDQQNFHNRRILMMIKKLRALSNAQIRALIPKFCYDLLTVIILTYTISACMIFQNFKVIIIIGL